MTPILSHSTAKASAGRHARPRRAMVLIVVMVVVAALSLGALAFSALMVSQREVTLMTGRNIQAVALAESGIEAARQFLREQPDVQLADGAWHEDPDCFQGVLVVDDEEPRRRGRFSIVAPGGDTSLDGVRFGLECESAKLNLNILLSGKLGAKVARDRLMALPDMTEEIADAILDWLDPDDEPREFGAEAEYYESLDPPYQPANGPFQCLDELLDVRGVTAEHLYGADQDRNGTVDPNASDASDGDNPCGWSAYLTLFSRERLCQADGQPKINLNQDDAEALYDALKTALDEEAAKFIVGYRQQKKPQGGNETTSGANSNGTGATMSGASSAGGGNTASEKRPTGELDLTQPLRRKIGGVLDLVGVKIKVKYKGSKKAVEVGPLFRKDPETMGEYLPKLTGVVTTNPAPTAAGRINVNLAPTVVLAGVPGVDATLAEEIVRRRPEDPLSVEPQQRHPTWLLLDGLVSLKQMKAMLPYLTAGGSVYQVQSAGFFDEGGTVARLHAVLDATESPPRMLLLKNLTPLGRGFDPTDLGAEP